MMTIRYELDKKQLRSVERDLRKLRSRMPMILSRTVNKTATSARMSLTKELQDTYTEKPGKLKQNITIRKASHGYPVAKIRVSGKAQPSILFHHSKGGRGGAKLQVRTDRPFKAVISNIGGEGRKAFIAQMPSKHKGIFQRRAGEYMKRSPRLSKAGNAKKSQHTERIKELFGPSPVKMVEGAYGGRARFTEEMGPEIKDLFQKYFGQQVGLILGKKKGGGA